MSVRPQRLYELQQLDLEIDAKTEELARVESQLGESEELIATRTMVQEEKDRRQRLAQEQKTLEWEDSDLSAKVVPIEEKLYSGRVKNPKELGNLQQEADGLKAKRLKAQDRVLDIMTELEDSLPALHQKEQELARVEAVWKAEQERLLADQRRLKAEIEAAEEKRQALIAAIPQIDLDLYSELRETKRGRAVARVEKGMCQGCRISLPMNEIQRARVSPTPARCSSCGRILIVG